MPNALTAEKLKRYALDVLKVDALGVANIERFRGAPSEMDPRSIMPRARSVVVFIKRILRGTCRGIDEGTHYPSYSVFCYSQLNHMLGKANYKLCRFIEDHGYEASPQSASAALR